MLSYADFHSYFRRLHAAYSAFDSLEDALCTYAGNPMERLCAFLEVSAKSPQKKLNMFLRWMIRKGPEVDFGIWERFDCRDLIVPLDTHVCRVAYALGLTETETFSLKNARRILKLWQRPFRMTRAWGTLLCLEAESAEYCSVLPVNFLYPSAP